MSIRNQNFTFIGGGNMTAALVGGLTASGIEPRNIRVGEPNAHRRAELERNHGVCVGADNALLIRDSDVVIFAVKPQQLAGVAQQVAHSIGAAKPLIISIAAGVKTASLASWFDGHPAIVRVMPNMPALIGHGAAGLFASDGVTAAQRVTAESVMRSVGEALWIDDESLMDAVTAISGSGPAYFFLVIEAMEAAAVELGLDLADARRLIVHTALGASRMVKAGACEPADLRRQVTSPGGTTAAAMDVLEAGELRRLFGRALRAANNRGRELSGGGT